MSNPAAQDDLVRVLGMESVDELINKTVPLSIIARGHLKLPEAATEAEALAEMRQIAALNKVSIFCPAVVMFVINRSCPAFAACKESHWNGVLRREAAERYSPQHA